MDKLKTFTEIIKLTRKFNEIKRNVVLFSGNLENDSEHSFQLALCSWFLALQLPDQNIDLNKVLLMSLVHDLPETGSGDVSSIAGSLEAIQEQKRKETLTIEKFEKDFVDFPELVESIKDYERRDSIEAELFFFVDKILPVLNVWLSKDSYYKDHNISFEIWMQKQYGRIEGLKSFDKFHSLLGEEILELIKDHKSELFV